MSEQEQYNLGYQVIRDAACRPSGEQVCPLPYGGKPRQIMVDINPQALYSRGPFADRFSMP